MAVAKVATLSKHALGATEGNLTLNEGYLTQDVDHLTQDVDRLTLDEDNLTLVEDNLTLDEDHPTPDAAPNMFMDKRLPMTFVPSFKLSPQPDGSTDRYKHGDLEQECGPPHLSLFSFC